MVRPFLARRPQNAKNMGATRKKSQRVILDYFLTDANGNEFCLGVTAQVDFGNSIEYAFEGFAIGAATDDEVNVDTCAWLDADGVHECSINYQLLPEAMREVIEQLAIEKANEIAFT